MPQELDLTSLTVVTYAAPHPATPFYIHNQATLTKITSSNNGHIQCSPRSGNFLSPTLWSPPLLNPPASLASSLTVVNYEFKQDASNPTESSSPQPNRTCTPQPEQLPHPTNCFPLPPAARPAPLPSSSSIKPTGSTGAAPPRPVYLTLCPAPAATSEPGSPGRSDPTDQPIALDERTEHTQPNTDIADDTGNLSVAPDGAPSLNIVSPVAAPLPTTDLGPGAPQTPLNPSKLQPRHFQGQPWQACPQPDHQDYQQQAG
ncbi:hypothetical protein PTTG_01161 [Puccinia triticina 1-1 BBBD Race 1]|uniref:Uncharacterized protein n=1 Tax=Puccinia triticina (isolate 1-1 / race 1 (BBBD)) TaxID=630390 RepID=A0A180H0K1_PUCT1|nr:hypothetical protein PTTG_01161 [Puccinia triticina 1-1 BBBD Race 1]